MEPLPGNLGNCYPGVSASGGTQHQGCHRVSRSTGDERPWIRTGSERTVKVERRSVEAATILGQRDRHVSEAQLVVPFHFNEV